MRIYLEAFCLIFYFSETPAGELIRKIFRKAHDNEVTIITSGWSINQFLDELIFLAGGNEEEILNTRILWSIMARKQEQLGRTNRFIEVGLTSTLLDSSLLYVVNAFLTAEQAIHVFSAKLKGCDIFVIGDERFRLEKERWKNDFDVYHLNDEVDVKILSTVLNSKKENN
jgi:hypothetical protein